WRSDVAWRADRDPAVQDEEVRRLLPLVPPRPLEAIELPLWAVRRWLMGDKTLAHLADVATGAPEEKQAARRGRKVFRWTGNDGGSRWIDPAQLRPGDTIIVPAVYGGLDRFGWNPNCTEPVLDAGRMAAQAFAGRRFAV